MAEDFDGVVAASGGDYTTLQAADDDLDVGAYTVYVKNGTYAAGLTVSTNNARWVFEPGTIVQGAITFSGANIECIFMPGCDIQAILTMSGADCFVQCMNGCDFDGLVVSGANGYFDGGGWDTLVNGGTANDAIQISGDDCIVKNTSCQTTAGGASSFHGVDIPADTARASIVHVRVVDSDNDGINSTADTADAGDHLILGCVILGADGEGIQLSQPRSRLLGNYILNAGTDGIALAAQADNSVCVGNVVQDQAVNSVEISATCENCVVVSNRLDGAVSDSSGTSTVADNSTGAF